MKAEIVILDRNMLHYKKAIKAQRELANRSSIMTLPSHTGS
jgi:hypothetical protein